MKITSSVWAKALTDSLNRHPQIAGEIVKNFLKKLARQRQTKLLPAILRQVKNIETAGIIYINSSYKLTPELFSIVSNLARKLFPDVKNPQFVFNLNDRLIGGVKISYQDQEFDASLARKISRLKEQLCR